jgi:hypothetical protein
MMDPASGVAVRLRAAPDGAAFAVTFAADAAIRRWYPIFDNVCRSARLAPDIEAP